MSTVKLFVLVLCLTVACESRKIEFKDCGQNEVKSVDVDPCDAEPCHFKKKSIVHVSSDVVSSKDVASGTLKVTVLLGDVEVEYPGIEPDICKLTSCPIKKGDPFTVKMDVEVASYFPAVSILMLMQIFF